MPSLCERMKSSYFSFVQINRLYGFRLRFIVLLLDDSVYINGPDLIVGIFHIFIAISKLRLCRRFGRGGCFLNDTIGTCQIGYAI